MQVTTLLILFVLITGCARAEGVSGVTTPQTADPPPESHARSPQTHVPGVGVVQLTVRDLASRLGRDPSEITVLAVEAVAWPDRGLGCPLPRAVYAPAITPGYRVRLEADGEDYTYHTDDAHAFVQCRDGSPELPVIPMDPDDIQDGTPWMPVDPPPTASEDVTIAEPDTDR